MSDGKHWDYYLITGKKLQPVVEATIKSHNKWRKDVLAIVKKYGGKEFYQNSFGLELTFSAMKFEKVPDLTVWKRVFKDRLKDAYWPRRNTVKGREVYAELQALKRWQSYDLSQAVGYKGLHHWDRMFPFNACLDFKKKKAYFAVPSIPPNEKTPKDWYKPVAGVRKVSYKKLTEMGLT